MKFYSIQKTCVHLNDRCPKKHKYSGSEESKLLTSHLLTEKVTDCSTAMWKEWELWRTPLEQARAKVLSICEEAQTAELVNGLLVSESTWWKTAKKAKKGAGSVAVQTPLAGPWLGRCALPSQAEEYSTSLIMPLWAVTCSGFTERLQFSST